MRLSYVALLSLVDINVSLPCVALSSPDCNKQTTHMNPVKPSSYYMYSSLTFNSSTVCPHSVLMCFVWISEQTVIIFLSNINWLVFILETTAGLFPAIVLKLKLSVYHPGVFPKFNKMVFISQAHVFIIILIVLFGRHISTLYWVIIRPWHNNTDS
jgi:hypothetical protein